MKVAIVSEFYPRADDPVLGVWAHRQAVAARDAGADVRVLVLYRPVPPRAAVGDGWLKRAAAMARQPRHAALDGLDVRYVPFLSPPRPSSYGSWGAWAAAPLALALRRLHARFPYDLVHAHNAVPSADATLRAHIAAPLVVSVHGGDVFYTAPRFPAGDRAVRRAFETARLVLANSSGVEDDARRYGARDTRVVRLGADVPNTAPKKRTLPTVVTVGHLVARKRHADVVRALWLLRESHPTLRYLVIGDGPEREPLEKLASDLEVDDRVEFAGQLPHEEALARAGTGHVFVMPSVDEAFGVAYVEAMAAGVPAVGARGEPGPEEIAAAGEGLMLVAPGDVEALASLIDDVFRDRDYLHDAGERARATVRAAFTWERCGRATVAAYEDALRG